MRLPAPTRPTHRNPTGRTHRRRIGTKRAHMGTNYNLYPYLYTTSSTLNNDIADDITTRTLGIGDYLETVTYWENGTHGGTLYKIVAEGTGTDDGGSYIDAADLQLQAIFEPTIDVTQFGAKGDGTTDDTTAIQTALNTTSGVTYLPPGTYLVSSTITIPDGITVQGANHNTTTIQLAATSNTHIFESADYDTLSGTNAWLVSAGVPTGFGIEHLRIDGNKANNTSGDGIRFYGKRFRITDVMVHSCAGNGIRTECANAGGQAEPDDAPECEIRGVYTLRNGGHGYHYLGPHDGRIDSLYTFLNDGHGFYNQTVTNQYGGLVDIGYLHSYTNGEDGVRLEAPASVENVITESNQDHGLYLATTNIHIGQVYAFNNDVAALDSPAILFAAGTAGALINQAAIRCDNAGIGAQHASGALDNTIAVLQIAGQTTDAVALDIVGNRFRVGDLFISDCTTGTAIRVAAGVTYATVRGTITGCATVINYLGGTTNSTFDLDGPDVEPPTEATTTNLTDATHTVNTTSKHTGRVVYNTTTNRPVWATGAGTTATWVHSDGTTAHTPA